MDSSNSGSHQSSSVGADKNEEYDSRTRSISSLAAPFEQHLLQPPPSSHHRPPPSDAAFFDPSSASPFSNPNPLQHLASVWNGTTRPLTDFATDYPTIPNPSTMDPDTKTSRGSHQLTSKNPKKRTRASRRAPTTVLTTDTTNFRQMVQEFTGIPTAPFTSAPFSRRLDLFSRVGDGGATAGSLYPLRPAAQKLQQQPQFLNSTASIIESGTSNDLTTATTSSNYPSEVQDLQKQASTMVDLQNPMLSFQSLLQSTLAQQSLHPSASKRWRGEDERLESFEGVIGHAGNIVGSKISSGLENVAVSSRRGGDQVQGDHESWICPSPN